jgi:hypothetical protein
MHERECFVIVAVPHDLALGPRNFVVPRSRVAASAWIRHMDWLTDRGIPTGKRSAPVERSRVSLSIFSAYDDRWDLLLVDEGEVPVLLPQRVHELALDGRVGLPDGHARKRRLATSRLHHDKIFAENAGDAA